MFESGKRRPVRHAGALPTVSSRRRYWAIMAILGILSLAIGYGNLAWGNPMPMGSVGFWRIAELRGTNLVVTLLVAFCQGLGTVAFQTATTNRIITPSIMGFESLYRLVQTTSVFLFGVAGIVALKGDVAFLLQVGLMVLFSAILYGTLLTGRLGNLHTMLLVGIILGGGLGALSSFMARMLTPTEFDLLTARMIGSVANADASHLRVALPLVVIAGGVLWLSAGRLNALALGKDVAVNLGVDHRRHLIAVLLLVSVLMAMSTSLIGPMTFFGFLVAMIAYQLADTHDHRHLFPMTFLVGFVVLGGAYFLMKNVFYAAGSVGIIIEIVGGTFFLIHLLRKGRL